MKNFIISIITLLLLTIILYIIYKEYKVRYLREPKPVPDPLE